MGQIANGSKLTRPQPTTVLAAASVTATTAGTAIALIATLNRAKKFFFLQNTLNQDVMITYDGADWFPLLAGLPVALDLGSDSFWLEGGKAIGVYHLGVAPASGKLAGAAW